MTGDSYLPPVVIQVLGDDTAFLKTLTKDGALLKTFAKDEAKVLIGADDQPLLTGVAQARVMVEQFTKLQQDVPIGVDTAPLIAGLAKAKTEVAAFTKSVPWAKFAALNVALETLGTNPIKGPASSWSAGKGPGAIDAALAAWAEEQRSMPLSAKPGAQFDKINAALAAWGGGAGAGLLAGGAGGAGGAGAAGAIAWLHAAHLALPEILGLATALASVAAGFTALAVAAGPSVVDIQKGVSAVNAAQGAIAAAIPGTSQWGTAVQSLGQAWSQIPTALQPAVSAIHNFMSASAKSPATQEIQGWLGAQAQTLTHLFSSGSGVFEPLILATQRAIDTVEGMFSKMAGSGSLTHLVGGLAHMVGPALVELTQLGVALVNVASGFAKAVTDGQGLEMLVGLFRSLGQIINSSLFQGFIAGWVDFDRIISVALGVIAKVIGALGSLGVNMNGVGTALGFLASGFASVKAVLFLLGRTGAASGAQLATFSSKLSRMLTKGAGIGLLAAGITGLAGNIASLLHTSNPLSGLWHAVGGALGFVSKSTTGAISTIKGYQVQLSGAIPITGRLSAAMDLLVRSEQSIGSSLSNLAQGFAPMNLAALGASKSIAKVTDSVTTLENNLAQSTSSTAQWAADAQTLIKRGMDPAAVASLAQQAPQDLASMATGTTAQLQHMNVLWQEKMLEASMSGQKGIEGMIAKMRQALTNGTPVMRAAAAGVAKNLGAALHIPYTGTVQSLNQIGAALNTLPTSVIQTLAGKTHQYSAAASDAASKTTAVKAHVQSLGSTLLGMLPNLAMVIAGLKMSGLTGLVGRLGAAAAGMLGLGGASTEAAAGEDAAAASAGMLGGALNWLKLLPTTIGVAALKLQQFGSALLTAGARAATWAAQTVASAARFAAQYAVAIARAIAAGVVWAAEHAALAAAFIAENVAMAASATAAFIAENIATLGIAAAIALLIAGVVYAATHWKQVWGAMKDAATAVWDALKTAASALGAALSATWGAMESAARTVWGGMESAISSTMHAIQAVVSAVWGAIQAIWSAISPAVHADIISPIQMVLGVWQSVWGGITSAVQSAWSVLSGIFSAIGSGVSTIIGDVSKVTSAISSVSHLGGGGILGSIASGFAGALSHIPHLAAGGLVSAPTLALVGEAGPEMVIPMSRVNRGAVSALPGSGAGFGGASIVINQAPITINAAGGNVDVIAPALRRALDQRDRELISKLRAGTPY